MATLISKLCKASQRVNTANAACQRSFFRGGRVIRQEWKRTLNNVKFIRIVISNVLKRVSKEHLLLGVQQIKTRHKAVIRREQDRQQQL